MRFLKFLISDRVYSPGLTFKLKIASNKITFKFSQTGFLVRSYSWAIQVSQTLQTVATTRGLLFV